MGSKRGKYYGIFLKLHSFISKHYESKIYNCSELASFNLFAKYSITMPFFIKKNKNNAVRYIYFVSLQRIWVFCAHTLNAA
jgi:hypothetical protein